MFQFSRVLLLGWTINSVLVEIVYVASSDLHPFYFCYQRCGAIQVCLTFLPVFLPSRVRILVRAS